MTFYVLFPYYYMNYIQSYNMQVNAQQHLFVDIIFIDSLQLIHKKAETFD